MFTRGKFKCDNFNVNYSTSSSRYAFRMVLTDKMG